MKFGVHIPVWGRYELLGIVLEQLHECRQALLNDGIELELALAVSETEDKEYSDNGWQSLPYVEHVVHAYNHPLADKCNAAVQALKDCDACVGIGSDDLIHPNLFSSWAKYIHRGYDQLGVVDGYFYDVGQDRLVHWKGYPEPFRTMDILGMGRCLTRKALQAMDWKPFMPNWKSRLDMSMSKRWHQCCWDMRTYKCKMRDINAPMVDVKMPTGQSMNPMPEGEERGSDVLRTWFGGATYERMRGL
jgi:hypothetical protein